MSASQATRTFQSSRLVWSGDADRRSLGVHHPDRDRRIRTRPAELGAYRELGLRSVWIEAKKDLGRPLVTRDVAASRLWGREGTRRGLDRRCSGRHTLSCVLTFGNARFGNVVRIASLRAPRPEFADAE